MRLFAHAPPGNEAGIVWLMIYQDEQGTYLFGSSQPADGGEWDEFYDTVPAAQQRAAEAYGVPQTAWHPVADPLEGCQHDYLQPVRVKGRALGQPEWGRLEKLVEGQWLPLDSNAV